MHQRNKVYTHLISALWNALAAAIMTVVVYQFFYIEFFRSNIEDYAFDLTNWFAISKKQEDLKTNNLFVLLVDDKYLKSQKLLDENNETTYGYILPRNYLVNIIKNIDALSKDIDEENHFENLFLDYDFSYLSDPHNKIPTQDDLAFLEILKKDRPYTIYLPITSNYNFIYHSKDKKIQKLIKSQKIKFVSVSLTTASDDISRRYYSYEKYKDTKNKDKRFYNIAIELWLNKQDTNNSIKHFRIGHKALIENRIIFKDMKTIEKTPSYNIWQSNWKQFSSMSASYPLDMIYEDDLRHATIMVGAGHSASDDIFEIDDYSKSISGVEMHANAFMTLQYLDGTLKRVPLVLNFLIIFLVVFIVSYLIQSIYSLINKNLIVKEDTMTVIVSVIILAYISSLFLEDNHHLWFNWLIPAMMSAPYLMIMSIKKLVTKG